MSGLLSILLACRGADPDVLLRKHDLDGAEAAWEARTGEVLDLDHPVADILARRAATDGFIRTSTVADAMDAVRLLERSPQVGVTSLDLSVDTFEHLLGAVGALADGDTLAVVGRSESGLDADPFTGGPLPWRGGRIVGWARKDFDELGARVDREPVPRLVTLRLRDDSGELTITFAKRDKVWWSTAATDADAGARIVLAGNLWGEKGDRATRQFYGRGVFRR